MAGTPIHNASESTLVHPRSGLILVKTLDLLQGESQISSGYIVAFLAICRTSISLIKRVSSLIEYGT